MRRDKRGRHSNLGCHWSGEWKLYCPKHAPCGWLQKRVERSGTWVLQRTYIVRHGLMIPFCPSVQGLGALFAFEDSPGGKAWVAEGVPNQSVIEVIAALRVGGWTLLSHDVSTRLFCGRCHTRKACMPPGCAPPSSPLAPSPSSPPTFLYPYFPPPLSPLHPPAPYPIPSHSSPPHHTIPRHDITGRHDDTAVRNHTRWRLDDIDAQLLF